MTTTDKFYQAYLNSRHAKFNTPETLVFEMTRRAINQTPVSRAKIVKGNDKEVYFVATAEGQEVVAIVNQTDESFAGEAWCLTQLRKAGVPVPEVLLFDCLEHEGKAIEFMVQSKISGQPLESHWQSLTAEQRQNSLRQMGEVLAQIHAVRADGFYKRHADGNWDFSSWSKLMKATAGDRRAERKWILQAGFSEADFAFLVRMIERYEKEFDCDSPVLCHGDYSPDHVFVDDNLRVCGVIDFGDYQGNHPVHDFAVLRLWEDEQFEKTMRQGYEPAALFDDRFELRLHLHLLALQVGYLVYHIQIPNHPDMPSYVQSLQTNMKWLQEFCR